MTCSSCDPWGSLSGRVITGRNTPGENIRYPLTSTRRTEHYGAGNLPSRGTGLPVGQSLDATNFLQGLTVGFLLGAFILTATGRGILSAAGGRVERRLR